MPTSEHFADRPLPQSLGGAPPNTPCDVCLAQKGIRRLAVCERKVGGLWAYVCGYCRRRVDGERNGS